METISAVAFDGKNVAEAEDSRMPGFWGAREMMSHLNP
jgi:hypothetical protein